MSLFRVSVKIVTKCLNDYSNIIFVPNPLISTPLLDFVSLVYDWNLTLYFVVFTFFTKKRINDGHVIFVSSKAQSAALLIYYSFMKYNARLKRWALHYDYLRYLSIFCFSSHTNAMINISTYYCLSIEKKYQDPFK